MALISAKSSKLPSIGKPLDVYYTTDTKETYFVAGDGVLLNARDILQGITNPARAVGPQGQPGRDGVRGERGDKGEQGSAGKNSTVPGAQGPTGPKGADGLPGPAGKDGKEGKDGRDSTVPGPRGEIGIPGPCGPMGETSYIYVGPAEVEAAHKEIRAARARLLATIQDSIAQSESYPPGMKAMLQIHLKKIQEAL